MRRTAYLLAFVLAALAAPMAVHAQQNLTVMIDGSAMGFPDQPPIERAGRIYVPMRAIFERLGATVVYDNGTINATDRGHTVQLQIGSPTATVDGQQVQLDSPPFEIAGRTLVPLRFVSQALGARVRWDENRMTAYIMTGGMAGAGPNENPPPNGNVPPYRPGTSQQRPGPAWADQGHPLLHRPYPWGSTSRPFPLINASFQHPMDPSSIVIRLDGHNVTGIARVRTLGFEFTPAFALHVGPHTISVTGRTQDGRFISDGWTFQVTPQ